MICFLSVTPHEAGKNFVCNNHINDKSLFHGNILMNGSVTEPDEINGDRRLARMVMDGFGPELV